MVAEILQRLCQEEALKDFKSSDLLPPIFSEVYFEYLVMCRRGHEQIHEFFYMAFQVFSDPYAQLKSSGS